MANPTLNDYIKTQRSQGVADTTIRSNLLSRGWSEELISESMNESSENVKVGLADKEVEKKPQDLPKIEDPNAPLPIWKILIAIFGIVLILWFVISLAQLFPM